jgi:hypothetical protein
MMYHENGYRPKRHKMAGRRVRDDSLGKRRTGRILREKDGAIGCIIMDHVARLNALTAAMWRELPTSVGEVADRRCTFREKQVRIQGMLRSRIMRRCAVKTWHFPMARLNMIRHAETSRAAAPRGSMN